MVNTNSSLLSYRLHKQLLDYEIREAIRVSNFLDIPLLDVNTSDTSESEGVEGKLLDSTEAIPPETIMYIDLAKGQIDPRLKLLSHSSRNLIHSCPRKYQLYRLNSKDSGLVDIGQGVTFAYGHAVGTGIQSVLEGKSETEIFLDTFLSWDVDLLDRNDKQKKSFWEVMFSIQRFMAMKANGYLDEYELVYYNGKPAVELSFQILLPDGFKYRGYVDAVLRHKETGAIVVLECKTSSGQPNSANFKNSGQALGYSIVLDILFPKLSSYTVLYLVYYTKGREYIELPFDKSLLQKALWLQELLIECKKVELYEEFGAYPMHGESCFNFFKACEYLGLCTLSTGNLVKPLTSKVLEKIAGEEYMFTVDFYDLVDAQIEKGEE